jgi:hypothetical protein
MSNVPILFDKPDSSPTPADASTGPSPTDPIFITPNGRFYSNGPNGLAVGGVFAPGSYGARAIILLHELAHKVGLIPDDRLDVKQSMTNTATVMKNCAETVK